MTTTTIHQFASKREFASHIISLVGGRSWTTAINKMHKQRGNMRFIMRVSNMVIETIEKQGVSHDYWGAAYGLAWGVETGRIAPIIVNDLGKMTARQLLEFLYQISADCPILGDVPRYVINWYLANHPEVSA